MYFIVLSMYSYFMFIYFHRASWHSLATMTEVFPCFFLSCKANARENPTKMGQGPHSSKIVVLFYVLFVLCRSTYCFCVNVYCTTATGWLPNLQLTNMPRQFILRFALNATACCHRVRTQQQSRVESNLVQSDSQRRSSDSVAYLQWQPR